MKLTTEQITKLKVTEIRDELKLRGLDQSGTKALLISRLIANVEKETAAEKKAPTLTTEPPATEPAGLPIATEQTKIDKPEIHVPAAEEDGEIKPKHKPIVYNIPNKDSLTMKADEEEKKRRRAERFGMVEASEHESKKLKARSERFNLKYPESEAAKLELRAKRFAQPQSTSTSGSKKDTKGLIDLSHIVTTATMTEDEKKKRRAERFGTAKN